MPKDRKTALKLAVSHHPAGDWQLIVRADGQDLFKALVGPGTAKTGWLDATVDLTPLAGRDVRLELLNQPAGSSFAAAYWATIDLENAK